MPKSVHGYLMGFLGVAATTGVLKLFGEHVNSTTVALALLVVVLFVATKWGARPAIAASLLGMLCLNFFFLPPVGTFTIENPDNWIALAAFLLTAVTGGQLSARAERRAEEAETARREIERLYRELQEAFDRASHAEALRQSEKLKSALLDAVTHDLRTPLTSIKASVTSLLDELRTISQSTDSLDAEGRKEMLEVINEETDRLNRFIEGLVGLARIEAGELQLRRRWGLVDEILHRALERAKSLTRNHLVEVSVESDLPVVRVDAQAVAEVVYTLVDNAAKYSPPGTHIWVSANRADENLVQMVVEDEGPGIPTDLRERVFDKFYRAMRDGDWGRPQIPGTGMGLAIARGIVEAHGGRIWIEEGKIGHGTQVSFRLPIGDEDQIDGELNHEREATHSHRR